MIKPPFTVVILKDSHQPVTIRVTKKFVLSLFLMVTLLFGITIFGIITYLPHSYINFVSSNVEKKSKEAEHIFIEYKSDTITKNSAIPEPDVKDLAIQQLDDGIMEITFNFANISGSNELYVWLIVNPDSESAGETLIYPRSPIFRGLPVDYRNGILYNPSYEKNISATFSRPIIGTDFNLFRILAYSLEGDIIIDKRFNIQKT